MNDSRKSKTNLFKYLEEALKKHLGYDICCMVYTQELIISDTLYETSDPFFEADFGSALGFFFGFFLNKIEG